MEYPQNHQTETADQERLEQNLEQDPTFNSPFLAMEIYNHLMKTI